MSDASVRAPRFKAEVAALTLAVGISLGCTEDLAIRSVVVQREDLAQYLTTNGRIEPIDDSGITTPVGGRVTSTPIAKGSRVSQGAVVATIEDKDARSELEQAKARLAAAEAELAKAEMGGAASETEDIKTRLETARRAETRALERVASLERLVGKQAAPRIELELAQAELSEHQADREAVERQWDLRADPQERKLAAARVSEAAAATRAAERRLQASQVRSPAPGVLYALTVRPGDYVERGAVIARVGKLDRVRVVVFVDEPELGRVKQGATVVLEADAYPSRPWEGRVDRLPTRIVSLDTRRVGEVLCTVDNSEGRLIPDLTVSARIETGRVKNSLTVPREALAQEGGAVYLWLLDDSRTARKQPVELGLRTASRVEVRSGVSDGAEVLLPGGVELQPGQRVRAGL